MFGQSNIKKLKAKEDFAALAKALAHRDPSVRSDAAGALVELGDPKSIGPVLDVLTSRGEAAFDGGQIVARGLGQRAVAPLVDEIEKSPGDRRGLAIVLLGFTESDAASEPLVEQLERGDDDARWAAAVALRNLEAPASALTLVAALSDVRWGVRAAAAEALERIGYRDAVPALAGMLDDEEPHVRGSAALALGKLGDPSCAPTLLAALGSERDWSVRGSLVLALGHLGSREAREQLQGVGRSDPRPEVRRAAEQALALLDGPISQSSHGP